MKLIIAGSRSIAKVFSKDILAGVIDKVVSEHFPDITEIVSGTAMGGDEAGEYWAKTRGVKVVRFPARWIVNGKFDKAAGVKRNVEMADYGEALIALWDGVSTGTAHMIRIARSKGLKVKVVTLKMPNDGR